MPYYIFELTRNINPIVNNQEEIRMKYIIFGLAAMAVVSSQLFLHMYTVLQTL